MKTIQEKETTNVFTEIYSGVYWYPYGDQVFVYDQVLFQCRLNSEFLMLSVDVIFKEGCIQACAEDSSCKYFSFKASLVHFCPNPKSADTLDSGEQQHVRDQCDSHRDEIVK